MSYMFLFCIILINRNCGDSIITFGFYCIQFVINYLQTTKICALTRIFNLNSFLLLKFYSHNHHSFFIMTSPGWIRTSENAGVRQRIRVELISLSFVRRITYATAASPVPYRLATGLYKTRHVYNIIDLPIDLSLPLWRKWESNPYHITWL